MTLIDQNGYRKNVGIVVINTKHQALFARRVDQQHQWQFPQGGIDTGESPEQAMYRELQEEIGLSKEHVTLLTCSQQWYSYIIPAHFRRHDPPHCIGQTQKWFLLELTANDHAINLHYSKHAEFDQWRWVSFTTAQQAVIDFKQAVYRSVLTEFHNHLTRTS